jgi:hypothetical protein
MLFCFLVELEPGGALKKELLHTRNIYILDCFTELFVWYEIMLRKKKFIRIFLFLGLEKNQRDLFEWQQHV